MAIQAETFRRRLPAFNAPIIGTRSTEPDSSKKPQPEEFSVFDEKIDRRSFILSSVPEAAGLALLLSGGTLYGGTTAQTQSLRTQRNVIPENTTQADTLTKQIGVEEKHREYSRTMMVAGGFLMVLPSGVKHAIQRIKNLRA